MFVLSRQHVAPGILHRLDVLHSGSLIALILETVHLHALRHSAGLVCGAASKRQRHSAWAQEHVVASKADAKLTCAHEICWACFHNDILGCHSKACHSKAKQRQGWGFIMHVLSCFQSLRKLRPLVSLGAEAHLRAMDNLLGHGDRCRDGGSPTCRLI